MKRSPVIALTGVTVAALIAAAFAPAHAPTAASDESSAVRRIEVRRIRRHFDSVLVELESRDVAALSVEQRAQRASLLATLRAYRDRGVFPHNYDFPGEAVPYFVDRKTGTLCAVAHLLASTGRRDIVDRVARADNNVRVAQLAGDSELAVWLDAHGLTLAEAARIQVPYVDYPPPAPSTQRNSMPTALPVTMGLSAASGLWNAFANADGHSRLANAIGVGSGLLAVGVGASQVGQPNVSRAASVTTAAVGGLGVAISVRSIHRHNVLAAAEREAARKSRVADATITPIIPVSGSRTGVSVSFRF